MYTVGMELPLIVSLFLLVKHIHDLCDQAGLLEHDLVV